ncbi:MAG: molybdopterin-dependent oxidoreductase [Bacteroidota bacterium]
MLKIYKILFVLCCLSLTLHAQTESKKASLTIDGAVKTTLHLLAQDLDKMDTVSVVSTDKANKAHRYSGVLLSDLLKKAGVTLGEELKGANLVKYLLVEASDNYKVVFALPEADPVFLERKIILANRMDGALLPEAIGPFQIIIEGEKKKARFVRQAIRITVKSAQ